MPKSHVVIKLPIPYRPLVCVLVFFDTMGGAMPFLKEDDSALRSTAMTPGVRDQVISPHEEKSDEELVRRSLADISAYQDLMVRYERRLIAYVRRLVGADLMDAEDIVQEVFINVYRNLNDFNPELKFSSWIYRIAHNEAVNHLRKKSSRPQIADIALFDDEAVEGRFIDDLNIEHEISAKFAGERVTKAIAELDPKYRDVLILRYFEDKNYEEIADIIKKPAGTVATLLFRAKKNLAERLRKDALLHAV